MNMPLTTPPKTRTNPLLVTAGIAVILFCATGTAAIMGWIPASIGSNSERNALTALDQTASSAASAQAAKKTAMNQAAVAPVHHPRARDEPRRTAAPVKAVCSDCGIVEATRETTVRGDGSGLGAVGGAVVGGLLGNQVGGGHGREAMTVVGAIGGALAGNQIEKQAKATHSYETTVRMNDGSMRAVVQATQPAWRNGDHVRIVDGVVRANG